MKIRNIVFALLLLSGISASAQKMPVPVDIRLKGEWQVKSVAVEKYHMKEGNLLGKGEIKGYDSISRLGMIFLNMEFTAHHCLIKQAGSLDAWDYARADSGILELKRTTPGEITSPDKQTPVLSLPYSFDSYGNLYLGSQTVGYMERSTGTPIKMKYICCYTRVH